ncbi:MAG: ECF transporter S component, partial [Clostridia bacterium]|nr:ECF transporter S component [Clostridia bacterium]
MLKRKLITVSIFFILMPVLILLGYFFVRGKQYYIVSLIVCVLSFVPFFMSLERKKLQARELVT